MRTPRPAWFVGPLLALLLVPAGSVAQPSPVPNEVAAAVARLTRPLEAVPLPDLPADPFGALITALNAHSASLGFSSVDHGVAILTSGMSAQYAGRVALLMQAVLACGSAVTGAQRVQCAGAVMDAAAGVIRTEAPAFRDVQAWPSLYIDGNGSNDVHVHDYAVLIDRGGNDVYDNNMGGNLLDHRRGPAGSAAPVVGAAIGCEQVQGNFPAPTATAHDCIAIPQAVLIDMKGNDVYGVFKPPRTVDHNPPATGPRKVDGDCTRDPLIRRIVLQGSGFEGNGMLLDVSGNDKYYGKTAAQGSGHIGGVGVLRDFAGNDEYLLIRNGQGFALAGTLGVLQDLKGNDVYHTYMTSQKTPGAAFQTDGSGGVVDDTGVCDNLPRMVQGAALLGGVGFLLDEDGRDLYVGAPANTQPFMPGILFFHSSQGFGCDGGVGILVDQGRDRDTYREGPAGRTNGASLNETQTACFAAPGQGIFRDDG